MAKKYKADAMDVYELMRRRDKASHDLAYKLALRLTGNRVVTLSDAEMALLPEDGDYEQHLGALHRR